MEVEVEEEIVCLEGETSSRVCLFDE